MDSVTARPYAVREMFDHSVGFKLRDRSGIGGDGVFPNGIGIRAGGPSVVGAGRAPQSACRQATSHVVEMAILFSRTSETPR
jgi:hypothetical protein